MSHAQSDGKGTWRQVAVVVNGQQIGVGPGALLTVNDDGYEVTVNGSVYQRGTSRNNYDTTPIQSDVMVTDGAEAGKTLPQIFQISGDVLLACIAPEGAARPKEFVSLPGSGHTLSVWIRVNGKHDWSLSPAVIGWRLFPLVMTVIIVTSAGKNIRHDLAANLGYWPSVVVSGLLSTGIVVAFSMALNWGWRSGLTMGLTMTVGINVFEELRKTLDPVLAKPLVELVSALTAFVVAMITGLILTRLVKSDPPPSD